MGEGCSRTCARGHVDHSEVVATVVAEVGVGALDLALGRSSRRTPRHLAMIVSDGYSSGPLGPISTSLCILFVDYNRFSGVLLTHALQCTDAYYRLRRLAGELD